MSTEVTRTVGVDLAAEAKRTALAVIEWTAGGARLDTLELDVDDAAITRWAGQASKIGIDCALGWPLEFVGFISKQANHEPPPPVDGGMEWRRRLAYRETDRFVREKTGRWPLSVSTDRLGLTAMRCAGLLGRLAAEGSVVDRSGTAGIVAEVYPGATLRLWRFDTTGYKADAEKRRALIQHLAREAPWLDLGPHADLMVASPDAFDAVIAALAARAAALGHYDPPPAEHEERARREGWIILPTCGLIELLSPGG